MKQLDEDQLYAVCLPHLQKAGYASENPDETEAAWLKAVCAARREHLQYGAQIVDAAKVFFSDDYAPENEETAAVLKEETAPSVLQMFRDELAALDDVTPDTVQPLFKKIQKGLKVKGKFVYMPIRVAVTRSRAVGVPPRWTWPSTVTRGSMAISSLIRLATSKALPAPSATTTI